MCSGTTLDIVSTPTIGTVFYIILDGDSTVVNYFENLSDVADYISTLSSGTYYVHTVAYNVPSGGEEPNCNGFTNLSELDDCLSGTCYEISAALEIEKIFTTLAPLECNDRINFSLGADCSTDGLVEALLGDNYDPRIYKVLIKTARGVVIPIEDLNKYVGETLIYQITSACRGNSCWGHVKIEDKLPIVITIDNLDDIEISCLARPNDAKGNPLPSVTGNIVATGTCSQALITGYTDEVELATCGNDALQKFGNKRIIKRITRTFTAANSSGTKATRTQIIDVVAGDLATLICPSPLVEIECHQDASPKGIASIKNDSTFAFPYVLDFSGKRFFLENNKSICNVIATYNDVNLGSCKVN
jgi:hypothetical protein